MSGLGQAESLRPRPKRGMNYLVSCSKGCQESGKAGDRDCAPMRHPLLPSVSQSCWQGAGDLATLGPHPREQQPHRGRARPQPGGRQGSAPQPSDRTTNRPPHPLLPDTTRAPPSQDRRCVTSSLKRPRPLLEIASPARPLGAMNGQATASPPQEGTRRQH